MRSILRAFTHSNLLAGVLGASAVCSTLLLFSSQSLTLVTILTNPVCQFLFFGSWGLYVFQRVYPHFIGNGKYSADRHLWFAQNKYYMLLITILCGIAGTFIFFQSISSFGKLICIGTGGIAILYGLQISFFGKQFKGLRAYGNLKIFLIGICWAILSCILPLIEFQIPITLDVLFYCFSRFLMCIVITIPFDIRDMELDLRDGISTLIGSLGEAKARILGVVLCVFAGFSLVGSYFISSNPLFLISLLLVVIYAILIYRIKIKGAKDMKLYWVFDAFLLYEAFFLLIFQK